MKQEHEYSPLPPDDMNAAYALFKLQLSLDVCINQRGFMAWCDRRKYQLITAFGRERLPQIYFKGWAMELYANRAVIA